MSSKGTQNMLYPYHSFRERGNSTNGRSTPHHANSSKTSSTSSTPSIPSTPYTTISNHHHPTHPSILPLVSNSTPKISRQAPATNSSDRIQVMCRFRPQIDYEIESGGEICVQVLNQTNCIIKTKRDLIFTYDRVFGMKDTQQDVFEAIGKPTVQNVLDGFNCTVFAYGQTSAGKTYTMMNTVINTNDQSSQNQRGLGPRIVDELFHQIEERTHTSLEHLVEFEVKLSFYEIYLERVFDLLTPSKNNLFVKEGNQGFYVSDLTEVYVSNKSEVLKLIDFGNNNKRIASNNMNKDSSRSHTILSINVTQTISANNSSSKKSSRLYIVDLAGSEKVSRTQAVGTKLDEAISINQSLATLGKVINCLTDENVKHVPYRESKLTKLLQDALGGNSKTVLLINCSPSSLNLDETLSTLRFGVSAKFIRNSAKINVEYSETELEKQLKDSQLKIHELTVSNTALEAKLEAMREVNDSHKKKLNYIGLLVHELKKMKEEVQTKDELISSLQFQLDEEKQQFIEQHQKVQQQENQKLIIQVMGHFLAQMKKEKEKLKQEALKMKTLYQEEYQKALQSLNSFTKTTLTQQAAVPQQTIPDNPNSIALTSMEVTMNEMKLRLGLLEQENKLLKTQYQTLLVTSSVKVDDTSSVKVDDIPMSSQTATILPSKSLASLPSTSTMDLKELDSESREFFESGLHHSFSNSSAVADERQPIKQEEGELNVSDLNSSVTTSEMISRLPSNQQLDETIDDDTDEEQEEQQISAILICGYVNMSDNEGKKWNRRWVMLPIQANFIKCYQNVKSLKSKDVPLVIQTTVLHVPEMEPIITIQNPNHTAVVMKFESDFERQEWAYYLKKKLKLL